MTRAGLIEGTGHGVFRISDRGRAVLAEHPAGITIGFLAQRSPEIAALKQKSDRERPEDPELTDEPETPDEALASIHQKLRSALAQELLERVVNSSPSFFERLVIDLLVAMGYGGSRGDAGRAVGGAGDAGIDGIIKEDQLGLDVVYVQAKRWGNKVGRPEVQGFAGSLEGRRARKGVMITTSEFTSDARDYVNQIEKRIVLIGGAELAELMIDHGVAVSDVQIYTVKRLDEDYFEGEPIAPGETAGPKP